VRRTCKMLVAETKGKGADEQTSTTEQ